MDDNNHQGIWKTPAVIAELVKCLTNKLTASSIAAHMSKFTKTSISRNAVIGKTNRMGMKLQSGFTNKFHPRKPKKNKLDNIWRPKAKEIPQPKPKAPVIESRNITLLQLEKWHCRYPYGDRAPFLFCGNPVIEGQSYCAAHADLCFTAARVDLHRLAGFRKYAK